MNKKRKVTKRLAVWFMCLAMVMTIINLPAFTTEVKAAEKITTWAQLKAAMESATEPTTIVLTQDIVATAEDKVIRPAETSIVLDLNGYTLDRNLSEPRTYDGCVFFMQGSSDIDLTIKDSSPAKTGVITGGYETSRAGCIELMSGSLTLLGGTITGNKTLYYGGGIDKYPYAKLMVGGTARVIGNYAYETGIKQWNSDIHFNDNVLDGFSFATGDDALVTEGEHKAQFGIRFWTGVDIAPVLWTLPSYEAGSCFVSNNQREQYMSQAKLVNGNWTLCLLFHDHEFDGEICTSKCELCGLIREDGIHNITGDGCTQECSYCHIKFHSDDTYDSKGVCPQCKAHRVDDETLLDYQGVRYRLKINSDLSSVAEVYGYTDDIKESVVIPKTIATSNGVFRVASFANGCFQGCTRVKDVDIQAEVTFIANNTFSGCSSLASINLPEGLTTIGDYAFMNCSALKSIVIPGSVQTIDDYAFKSTGLTSVTINQGVEEISGKEVFSNCLSLTDVSLPGSLKTIGSTMFSGCTSLAEIVIPNGVETIEEGAFSDCTSLTEVVIPDGVKFIRQNAFGKCTNLKSVTIPSSVISVELLFTPTFDGCSSDKLVINVACTEYLNNVTPKQWGNIKEINRVHDYTAEEAKDEALKSAATCLDKAVYYRSCTVCGHVHESDDDVFKYGSALGHEYTSETATAPYLKNKATCIADAVYYHKCSRCESKGATTWTKVGSALGHDWGEYILEGDQTCEEDGHKTAMCTREGCMVTNTIAATGAALGHEYTSETATAPYLKSKATCIADAVYYHKCRRCESRGATTWTKEGSALGHSWGEYHLDGDQTCTYDGHKTAECTREGCSEENKIGATGAALGHDWEDYFTTDIAATCTEAGSESRHCARCSATTDVAPIVAHGHSFTDYISNGDATTEADGTKTAVCDHGCGETDTVIDEGSRIKEPCESHEFKSLGIEKHICSVCGTKAAHNYDEATHICSDCNQEDCRATGNHDFSKQPYQVDEDGKHYQKCKDCGAESTHEVHTGGTATCKAKAKCTVCGEEYGSLAAHTYATKWSTDATNHWHACTVCGAKKDNAAHTDSDKNEKCDTCDYNMHSHFGTKVAQVDATCTSYGVKAYYKCSCGKYYSDSACTKEITDLAAWKSGDGRIEKKEHTLKTTTTKATLTANGKKETKCTVCGKVTKTETIYAAKTIKISATKYTYDGKAKKPTVTIKDSKGNAIASTNYTVTYPSGRKNVGKYTVKVTFKGNYSGSKNLPFTINPPKTSISKVTAGKKAFTVKWAKKTTQVTGYEIQYSTSSSFAKGNKTVKVTSAKTVSKTISKLTGGKKYYVRIRTYKTVGKTPYYSDWSAKKSVTTKK